MKTRFIFICIFGLMTSSLTVTAQEISQESMDELTARLEQTKQRLNLTEDQVEQIKPVLQTQMESSRQVLEKHGVDLDVPREQRQRPGFRTLRAIRKDMQPVRSKAEREMSEILTAEQMKEFAEIQEERSKEMRERIRGER